MNKKFYSFMNRFSFLFKYFKFVIAPREKYHVTMVIGDCGAGKTSYVVRKAQKSIKKGITVYSNMYIENCYKWDLEDFMINDIKENSIIIIDEAAAKGLASRGNSYKESNKPNIIEGFTMFRHYKIKEIFIVAPSFADVVPIVRSRTTRIKYIMNTCLSKFGIGKYKLIKKHVDIPLGNTEPLETFKFIPFIRGFYFQYPTFLMYNSFERKILKIKNWVLWQNVR